MLEGPRLERKPTLGWDPTDESSSRASRKRNLTLGFQTEYGTDVPLKVYVADPSRKDDPCGKKESRYERFNLRLRYGDREIC